MRHLLHRSGAATGTLAVRQARQAAAAAARKSARSTTRLSASARRAAKRLVQFTDQKCRKCRSRSWSLVAGVAECRVCAHTEALDWFQE
jgi:hypothetical protein